MKRWLHIQWMWMPVLIACILSACDLSHSSSVGTQADEGYVTLRISTGMPRSPQRQGRPQGGEYGDGLEPGQHHENDIRTLALYAYQGSVNAAASTPVKLVVYLSDLNLTESEGQWVGDDMVYEVRIDDKFMNSYTFSSSDRFIAVSNTLPLGATNLGELRNAFINQPVRRVAAGEPLVGCTHFVMSNERESQYRDGIGSADNPRMVSVHIERVTARVDLVTTGSTTDLTHSALSYPAIDGAENTRVADVLVTHARVFNAMHAPSYLLKRLAENESAGAVYLASEDKPATRMVVENYTWQKGSATADQLNDWYGDSQLRRAKAQGDNWFRTADGVHTDPATADNDGFRTAVSVDAAGQTYYVLDYVNENTMLPGHTNGDVTTGVLLRAIYCPTVVYKSVVDGEPIADSDYACGQTFWRYRPMSTTYDETLAACFSNPAAAQAYMDANPQVAAEITQYTNGLCYYPVFLRHDNTVDATDIRMMEFGIVRNNIYRLRLSFTGPGYPTLDPIDKVNPEGIRPYIFVRKWYKIEHPEIEL